MKHKWNNIREKMAAIYTELDSFAMLRVVFYEMVRMNKSFAQNFEYLNSVTPEKRLKQTPLMLINGLFAKADIQQVQRLSANMPEFNDGFPKTRICAGQQETDSYDAFVQSTSKPLW